MAESEIEVQVTQRVRDAVHAAIDKIGKKEFSKLSGADAAKLDQTLSQEETYVRVTVVSVACQVNKSHGDPDKNHSSISECLKGAIYRVPQRESPAVKETPPRKVNVDELKTHRGTPTLIDQKSVKILNFSANTISFLILGYFLGGIILAPLFGLQQCIGIESTSPWLSPCLGSGLGLVAGAVVGLAYTYYYFVKRI